jgi:PfaD family protein
MVDVAQAASTTPSRQPVGGWSGPAEPVFSGEPLTEAVHRLRERIHVVSDRTGRLGVASGGSIGPAESGWPVHAVLAEMYPEWLGDRSFGEAHGTRFPYVTGAMANGIATTDLVVAIARTGGLGFFGAAGLERRIVERAIDEMEAALGGTGLPWGCNLIHSPQEPSLEASVADLYIGRGVRRVSAAAFMSLTPSIVRYAYSGIRTGSDGRVQRPNMVFAKISRPETARAFMNPAPSAMLEALVAQDLLTAQEASLAATLPVAEDITIESDSGGHTDNRPLGPLFSAIQAERDAAVRRHGFDRPIRLGAAGGIGTPQAVASAFALGAAYVLTGTVNEACVESGLSDEGREMLAAADLADVTMAPAADMFELGVDLQVLQRGTMFASRAKKLYTLYSTHRSLDEISGDQRSDLETKILGQSVDQCWAETKAFWMHRDSEQVERAERDPRHRMALVFRSYLGRSSRWSIDGVSERRLDYQIWCGPAMGAFNAWTAGTFLAEPANRGVAQVARNLLEGAAAITRAHQLRTYGVAMPASAFAHTPRPLAIELDR